MIYELINSKICVGRVLDRYSIDYSGWINRAPNWISDALSEMNMYNSLMDKTVNGEVANYKCPIPDGTVKFEGVSYLGYRLDRNDTINQHDNTKMDELVHDEYSYSLSINDDGSGFITTTFEECDEGELKFYIKKLPVILDANTNLYWAMIPNNVNVMIAIDWYLLKSIMYRGHNIPGMSLTSPNRFNNPALAWEHFSRIAKIRVRALDKDDRHEISKLKRTLLVDYNYHSSGEFNFKSYNND